MIRSVALLHNSFNWQSLQNHFIFNKDQCFRRAEMFGLTEKWKKSKVTTTIIKINCFRTCCYEIIKLVKSTVDNLLVHLIFACSSVRENDYTKLYQIIVIASQLFWKQTNTYEHMSLIRVIFLIFFSNSIEAICPAEYITHNYSRRRGVFVIGRI